MTRADADWRLVREEARPGPLNMALDEVAARTAAERDLRTLRVYRWEPSTLSLGYHQDPDSIDWAVCEREGITVTRRPTGGGAIYHDSWGDVSYSIVAPADDLPGDLLESYEVLCDPLFAALEGIGVDARFAAEERPAVHQPACYLRALHPAHDVVAADGRKLSGNAQYRQRDAVVQHGSLTYERATERHLACFAAPETTPAEFDARVTSVRDQVDVERADVVEALETALADWADAEWGAPDDGTWADEAGWTDDELERARDLAREKYERESWVRDGEDPT